MARYAADRGLRVALATNGTQVTPEIARKIVDAGVRRVSISLDGACAATHDAFRGIPGAFESALRGFRNLKEQGMSVQVNTTVARHNAHELPEVFDLARSIGADALHTFLLVPVGCGVEIAESQMVPPEEYEQILNWFYDRSQEGGIELKATCAPHYFRVMRQRRAAERRAATTASSAPPVAAKHDAGAIGPTDMTMPGSTGMSLHSHAARPGQGHPDGMNAVTKGCLAGSGVCFISNLGEVFPCGYLPVLAGDLRRQSFADIWENSQVFHSLRGTEGLKGKCGYCEFRNICMGCRARAFAATGDYMDEEPFCIYQPKTADAKGQEARRVPVH